MKRGYFGIGVFHTKTESNIGTLMRSALCFGADFVFTVGRRYQEQASDTTSTKRHVPLYHYRDVESLVANLPIGCPLIGVELAEDSLPLGEFDHPERAAYLLGAEDHGLTVAAMRRCHRIVEVKGASQCLNVAVTGSIVMWDRIRRGTRGEIEF